MVVSTADLHHTETVLLDREDLRTYPEEYWEKRTAGPGALLLMLGVSGELPELEHHTLFFAKNWNAGFKAIFGDAPHVPETLSLYVCKPSGVDSGVAPGGRGEPLRAGADPRRSDPGTRRRRPRRGRRDRGPRRPGHRADRGLGRHPGSRGTHRAAPHGRARATSRPTSTRGRARPSGPRTRCGRARSSAPATSAAR